MASTGENDTEILLGNKHLLAIFFVIAILLGVAFTGGYMVGRSSLEKRTVAAASLPADPAPAAQASPAGLETHSVPPAPAPAVDTAPSGASAENPPLGSPRRKSVPATAPAAAESTEGYTPQSGQTFLQVAAVSRSEADAVADVLAKKGFQAHSVPKPGGANIYRVLIGPVSNAGDLSSTRDALRKTGFREVIVQRY
ncbi:MAG TPA: SPOR domain-containing protein [Bryobacteraceae bacterium]|jgi:cell division protein FtsN